MRPDLDLRSYIDTRAGAITLVFSALAITAAAALGGLLQPLVMDDRTAHLQFTMLAVSLPLTLVIPVVTVMMMAGEWADRSIQYTFLQRPRRLAVLASRAIAALGVSALILALSVLLAFGATWLGGMTGRGADFADVSDALAQPLAACAASFLLALAFAVLLQSTLFGLLAAIGVPFVLTIALGVALATGSQTVSDVVHAFDLSTAAAKLADGASEWKDVLPVITMFVIPFAFGVRRWATREVG